MGILNDITEKLLRDFSRFKDDDWVQWIAQENDWQDDCDKFNECYFIVKNMPDYPQHPNCQCRLRKIAKPIPDITAKATCDIRKFTGYVFSEKYKDGKQELFESWGYSIEDSEYLQQLYCSQALQKYCNGNYTFKGVSKYAVRIEIILDIETPRKGIAHIKTGWALFPNGEINLSTPFSGFAK